MLRASLPRVELTRSRHSPSMAEKEMSLLRQSLHQALSAIFALILYFQNQNTDHNFSPFPNIDVSQSRIITQKVFDMINYLYQ